MLLTDTNVCILQYPQIFMSKIEKGESGSTKEAAKKLYNRFDEWEVLSIFTETTSDHLDKLHTSVNWKFYVRCLFGILLAINAYLSHFGPWVWPKNYYFLIFSVIFYYVGSHLYGKLGDISSGDGTKVGEYIVEGIKYIYAFKLTDEKIEYILQEISSQSQKCLRKKSFNYLEYFTADGTFLEPKYLKHLEGFMSNRNK